jgi:hypothetical protein
MTSLRDRHPALTVAGAEPRPPCIAVGLSPFSLTRIEMCKHQDAPAANRRNEETGIDVTAAADGGAAEPRIAFRIGIGAGSILLLIVAALLLATALSKAIATP